MSRLHQSDLTEDELEFIERTSLDKTSDLPEPQKAIACAAYIDAWFDCLEWQRKKVT